MFISNNNAQLFTVDFGSGPRTLVAHGGWAGSWELWTPVFSCLGPGWRTVAYDHRGTGATLTPVESISLDAMVSDLFAVLDTLGIERCVLAGESAGATVVLKAAVTHPERFEGLVLVDGKYRHIPADPWPSPFAQALQSDFTGTISDFVDACVPVSEPNSAAVRRWGRMILERSGPEAAVQLLKAMHGIDMGPAAQQVRQPTLILHGSADVIEPPAASEWLAGQIPNNRLRVIQGAGHVPSITRPREVADEINAFFASPRASL